MLFITEYCSVKNTYSKVSKFPFHIHQCLKENFGNLSVNLEIHSIWLRHRSWDSMTHDTSTLILQCQCLVSCNCRKSPAKKAIQGHSGQMSSKSILIGFSIFLVWKRNIRAWKTFLGACSVRLHIPNYWRFSLMVQTCFKGMPLQWARRRVRSGSLFNAIFLKVNPGFWSSRLTWRREQHNEGWESGGKGAQKYGRQETLTSHVFFLSPPPPHTKLNKEMQRHS